MEAAVPKTRKKMEYYEGFTGCRKLIQRSPASNRAPNRGLHFRGLFIANFRTVNC
jgi:hypothetical protein